MKRFAYLALVALMPVASFAQGNYSFDDEVNAELEKMHDQGATKAEKSTGAAQGTQVVEVNVQAAPTQSTATAQDAKQETKQDAKVAGAQTQATEQKAPVVQSAPVVQNAPVVAAAAVAAPVVQKQATTVVEASPLQESKAEALRKTRQDAEIQTEQKIVEKLEESRLNDEKNRSEILFGDKLSQTQKVEVKDEGKEIKIEQKQEAVVAAAPVVKEEKKPEVVVAPVVVDQKEVIRNEVRASMNDMKKEEETPKNRTYFAGLLGMGNYPDVDNVRGSYALGFAVGEKVRDHFLVEGGFTYSSYEVQQRDGGLVCQYGNCTLYPRITQMNQYQGSAAAKYQFLNGAIRPVIGAVMAYSYRTFSDKQLGFQGNNATSNALDAGIVGGLDLAVSESFEVGFSVSYMWNITSQASANGFEQSFMQNYNSNGDTAIEKLSYVTTGLVVRTTF